MVYGERCSGRACVVRWSTRCLLLCGEREWWRARVSVSVFAYTCGRDRYDAARIIMCVENVGFRTGLPDAGAHSTVLDFYAPRLMSPSFDRHVLRPSPDLQCPPRRAGPLDNLYSRACAKTKAHKAALLAGASLDL